MDPAEVNPVIIWTSFQNLGKLGRQSRSFDCLPKL